MMLELYATYKNEKHDQLKNDVKKIIDFSCKFDF